MAILKLDSFYANQAYQLWNHLLTTGELLYKPINKDLFMMKFMPNDFIHSWIYEEEGILLGFISGVCLKDKQKAYLTMIMVDPKYQRQGIGSKLLAHFEAHVKDENHYQSIDIIFFNPIQFEWVIPNTNNHDHPNTPGVDLKSSAYLFFINQGYHTFALQNSYYKPIKDYHFSDEMTHLFNQLRDKNISITFYHQKKHHGFDDLFTDLKNPYWKDEITKATQNKEPVLVAEQNGTILGFTGPLRVQPSLRGYFAGIGVHSSTRGLGVGKVLFASLCMELKNIGATYMTLFTGETNPARKIYEHEGFEIVRSWANMRKEF